MQLISGKNSSSSANTKANELAEDVNVDNNPDSFLDGSVMEKILLRRSLRMQNMQRSWQVHLSCSNTNILPKDHVNS